MRKRRFVYALLAGLSAIMAVIVALLTNLATNAPRLVVLALLAAGAAVWATLEFIRYWGDSPNRPQVTSTLDQVRRIAMADTTDRPAPNEHRQPAPIAPTWRERAHVDHDPDGYFGRQQMTKDLSNALITSSKIITLQGGGGIGKTTTAYEAVDKVAHDGAFDSILWTKVRDEPSQGNNLTRRSWAQTQRDLADQLGVDLGPSTATWGSELRDAINDPRFGGGLLTVLDNLEIDTDMRRFTERLHNLGFAKNPHKLLVTSRAVVPTNLIHPFRLHGLENKAAIDLIRHLGAGDERLATTKDAAQLEPVLSTVEGNPLLIKLVVRRFITGNRSLAECVEELLNWDLGGRKTVKDHLFGLALKALESRAGPEAAHSIMDAFAFEGVRGGEYTAGELQAMSELDRDQVRHALDVGRDLGVVEGGSTNERYSIHSLLYDDFRRRVVQKYERR
ncbi:NB-ARC domain-containing protein [Glycomyces buryatensis]|uniref:NB-ARC domain-containing protein n=1 Tax=Glycomyces buryatensis TaxID=2570927 RepID=A0A4S8QNE4_9ACTN|nr:NB-ARC domain-containing protein [Glycomyces buryatensis]THV42244.1 hypothetical protein FAB82_07505 [Glycomyces buryatensis]